MITCKDFADFIGRFLDGDLSDAEKKEFDGHMEICPSCIDYLESIKTTQGCCKGMCDEGADVPADVPEELIQAILEAKKAAEEPEP